MPITFMEVISILIIKSEEGMMVKVGALIKSLKFSQLLALAGLSPFKARSAFHAGLAVSD